ncbi:MAG: hypothetical protein Q7T03_03060 [Deltaproteobacteria bacterium]|nr:hypothetical protein [Deltaproteobacteria bacterium]
MKTQWKIAWTSSVLLGTLMAVLNFLHYNSYQAIISFFVFGGIGFVTGLFFALVLIVINGKAIARLPYEDRQTANNVYQQREVILTVSYEEALEKCMLSLGSVSGCSIFKKYNDVIIAKTQVTWKSFGEIITLSLKKIDDAKTGVLIESKPRLITTLIDYGKNFDNVKQITNVLEGHNNDRVFGIDTPAGTLEQAREFEKKRWR